MKEAILDYTFKGDLKHGLLLNLFYYIILIRTYVISDRHLKIGPIPYSLYAHTNGQFKKKINKIRKLVLVFLYGLLIQFEKPFLILLKWLC